MSWYIFAWTVVPTGTLLALMLGSGNGLLMSAACKVLQTPVSIGPLQLSLAVVATAFCGALALLEYSVLQRCELQRADALAAGRMQAVLLPETERNVYRHSRNLYLCLLGMSLWSFAWRLKALYQGRVLRPVGNKRVARATTTRLLYAVAGISALLVADVPLCRVNYQLQLRSFVTVKKEKLLESSLSARCADVFASRASGECADFCSEVRQISDDRHKAIMWARDWHILGRLAAELFDDTRGVIQGTSRIDELFVRKTCGQVLRSVDRSNQLVNGFCIFFAGLSIMGAFAAFAGFLDEPEDMHED